MKHNRLLWGINIAARLLSAVLWAIALAPLALWCAMVSEAVRAWRLLGRWPSYDQPDPKTLSLPFRGEIELAIGIAVVVIGVFVALRLTRRQGPLRQLLFGILGTVILWTCVVILMRIDPGGVTEWYVD